jgi:hypothetical protein
MAQQWPRVALQHLQTSALTQSTESDKKISYLFYRKWPDLDTNGSIRTIQNRRCSTEALYKCTCLLSRNGGRNSAQLSLDLISWGWNDLSSLGRFQVFKIHAELFPSSDTDSDTFSSLTETYGDLESDRTGNKKRIANTRLRQGWRNIICARFEIFYHEDERNWSPKR